MAYPEDYPDDLTKAKASGYLHKHMIVLVDPATGLPYAGGLPPASTADTVVPDHPGVIAGRAYPSIRTATASAAVGAIDTLYVMPFRVPLTITLTGLGIRVTTAGTASNWKGGIYRNGVGTPTGAPLAVNNTGIATVTTGADAVLPLATTLVAGWYWIAQKHNGTLPQTTGLAASNWDIQAAMGRTANSLNGSALGKSMAHAYATDLPTLTGGEAWSDVITSGAIPLVFLLT
jgi:hypothetical protein